MRCITLALFSVVAAAFILTASVHAQDLVCGEETAPPPPSKGLKIPADGPFGALVFYVRFKDDNVEGTCARGYAEWPSDQDFPAVAAHLISNSPTPPFADSSLTDYFYKQSRGNFIMYGESYAYQTVLPEEAYKGTCHLTDDGKEYCRLDRGKLTEEILDHFNTGSDSINYRDFDKNGDGYLDHAFFVLRRLNSLALYHPGTSGVSGIDFNYTGPKYDDIRIDDSYSGSYNKYGAMNPLRGLVELLGHEFGHDLWGWQNRYFWNHLSALTGNSVPHIAPPHYEPSSSYPTGESFADEMTAYATMLGGDSDLIATKGYLSAFERAQINLTEDPTKRWIECDEMVDGQTYALGGLYSTGDCRRIVLDGASPVEELYISNLQRDSYFGAHYTFKVQVSDECPGCNTLEGGQPTTGLVVERTRRNANLPFQSVRDIIPGDNGVSYINSCDRIVGVGPTVEEHFGGDLWRPEERSQLSPWTRPNVYGYTFGADVPTDILASGWHVLDDLRYQGSGGTIEFDYHGDALALGTFYVRDDSWMDVASNGITFTGAVHVTNGATLTIEEDVTITFNEGLVVEPGATLVTEEGAVLQFGPGARLLVEGVLTATGTTFRESDPRQGWAGIDVRPAGSLAIGDDPVTPSATFAGSTIEGVELTGLTTQASAVVSVYNATADLSGTTIQGGTSTVGEAVAGLFVAGKHADITVRDISHIRLNSGPGILAQSDALVDVYGGVEIYDNAGSGVVAASGASVHLFQNTITDNVGYGVHATDYGIVAFSRPHGEGNWPDGYNFVANNDSGGLLADDGGTAVAGMEFWETGGCLQGCFNIIRDHSWAMAPFDAKAAEYGTIWATLNFWGDEVASVADLVLIEETGGIVVVDSVLTAPPAPLRPSGAPPAGVARADGGDPPGVAGRSDSPRLMLRAARAAASEGDYTGAFALLRQVIEAAEADYRRLAYTEALRLLREEQPSAVMTFLEGVAAGQSPYRPWALRALVVGYEAAEQPAQAEVAAGTLIEGFGGSRHALFGHLARVHLRLGQDDLAGAEAALAGAEVGWPAHPAVASARGLLAWLTDEEGSGARGSGAGEASTLRTDEEQAARSSAAAYRLSAYPNPSAGSATVSLELAAGGAARVAVYDVLGREVVVLADRVLEAGRHALPLTGGALPSGTYVVRVEVTEAGGAVRILTQKLILTR